jgi:transposase, IS5 family
MNWPPQRMLADTWYGTRANREYLKQRGIQCFGKLLGRPKQKSNDNREHLQQLR